MADHGHWQLDGSAPELYQRYLVPAITSIWAADLIERTRPQPGEAVLDVACGTGVVARLAAERVAGGRVVGFDLNDAMLAVARSEPAGGAAIEWMQGSALSLPFSDKSFDVVLCQLGLQFFPDKTIALREMRRVLAAQGRVALSVYSAIERTPAASVFADALDHCLGPGASRIKRGEHTFPVASEVASLMTGAGFEQVEVATVTKRITFPSVLDYVRFQLVATPMASLLADRNAADREEAIAAVTAETRSHLSPDMLHNGRLSFPQEAHVALAPGSHMSSSRRRL